MRFRLRVPEVVTLTDYDRLPAAAVTFSRRNIFKRDHFTCQYCGAQPGSEELTLDHVVPRAQGGESRWDNCVLACLACNKRKADRTPEQARMRLQAQAGPADVEPALRGPRGADRELVEVRQRGVLERRAGEVDDNHGSRPSGREAHLCRRGRIAKGAGFVNRMMLVQIQSSALDVPMV